MIVVRLIDQVISASQRTQGNKGRKGISLVPTLSRSQPAAILNDENGQVVVHVSLASKGGNITGTTCYLPKRDEAYRCSQSLQTGCRERNWLQASETSVGSNLRWKGIARKDQEACTEDQ